MRFPCHKTTKALQYVLQPNLADTAKESRAAYLKMADNEEDHVVADIDDTAERPMSDHEGDSEQEDASSMDGPDDSTHAFTGHTGPVFATAWNRKHTKMVASGGGDDLAFLWQTFSESENQNGVSQNGTQKGNSTCTGATESSNLEETTFALRGHSDSVACLQFNNEGDLLGTGGLDGQVRIWSTQSGECLRVLEGPAEGLEWICWHPKGNILLAGSEDFSIWMWNAATGVCMQVFTGHSGPVRCGSFTPDGKLVVTGGGEGDNSLKVWDPKNGSCTLSVMDAHNYHSAGLTALDIRNDSQTVCTGSEDATARLVNLQTGRVLGALAGHTDSVEAVAFVLASTLLATCSLDGTLRIWETTTLSLRAICRHPDGVLGLDCHPLGPFLYTSCLDGGVRSWDARTGTCLQTQSGHKEGIQALCISPDGSQALTGSDDCTAKVFEFDFSSSMM